MCVRQYDDDSASTDNNHSADTRAHADSLGGVMLFIALIGIAGAGVGASVSNTYNIGVLGTVGLAVLGFIGIIVGFIVTQLTLSLLSLR